MPPIRKRIGYLPSINIQEIITKIANKEKLSQSKVVGILVEEALIARGILKHQNINDLINEDLYGKGNNINHSSLQYNDLEELISDQGITYNTRRYKKNSDDILSEHGETYNEELFEQFKQFILFQKTIQEKQ